MNGKERRELILETLKEAKQAVSATVLAEKFGVTRQIVVADIALLRATGLGIKAEHRGYVLEKKTSAGVEHKIVCKHDKNGILDEFYAIVDNGGVILDIVVEHSIYGQISANLNIASRYDADEFAKAIQESEASQLSDLTGGVHIHTIQVRDNAAYDRIVTQLSKLGMLIEED
jgi:transcriptional regulator of NAD metabolism